MTCKLSLSLSLSPVQQPCDVACSEGEGLASYRPRSHRRRHHVTPRVLCYRHHGPQLAPALHLGACIHAVLPVTLRTRSSALLPTDFSGPPLVATWPPWRRKASFMAGAWRYHGQVQSAPWGCDIFLKSEHCSLGKALLYPMGGGGLCLGGRSQILK